VWGGVSPSNSWIVAVRRLLGSHSAVGAARLMDELLTIPRHGARDRDRPFALNPLSRDDRCFNPAIVCLKYLAFKAVAVLGRGRRIATREIAALGD